MMKQLIRRTVHNGEPVLAVDAALSPRAFAQSGLPRLQTESGYLIGADDSLQPWNMNGTRCVEEDGRETMEFFGPDMQGKPLLEAIEGEPCETAWPKLHSAFSKIHRALMNGNIPRSAAAHLGSAGPAAVFCGDDGSVLVLPPQLIIRCAGNRGEQEEIDLRLKWIHPDAHAQDPLRAFAFAAGTAAYRALSGSSAFSADGDKKSENLAEKQRLGLFESLDFAAPGYSGVCARAVDSLVTADKAASLDTLLAFGPDPSAFVDASRSEYAGTQAFATAREAARSKREGIVKRRRFARKHKTAFIAAAGLAVVAALVGATVAGDMKSKPTTLGKEPLTIVQEYYRGLHQLDQEIPRAYSQKGVRTDYDEYVTNLYVTSRMRDAYERNGGILAPAELFLRKETNNRMIWGLTKLKIEGENTSSDGTGSAAAATEVRPGETREFIVSFWLWMPNTPGMEEGYPLSVWRYVDRVILEYGKDRWLIREVIPETREMRESDPEDILKRTFAPEGLSEPWAPDEAELAEARVLLGID
ncbi:hypothetical protein K7J14_09375 [Treponema zuelzerae]|uniref:Uncharacterized protein n=1 Tax=Teretinema zuelzerae TaxID=156 RepID=A0AAE3EK12_9SPIR|nr:hypothetical protein [Teretinema zuelzerae]MCD1654908.1 hypothetical protein [Teretinema zuelzerae]